LVYQTFGVNETQRSSCLLQIGNKLFGEGSSSTTVRPAKKIIDGLRGIFHNKVRPLILQLTEVVDWQDIAVLQVGNTPRFIEKVAQRFLVELVDTQYFECQDTAQGCGFTHLIDMAVAACADEGDDFVDADMCSFNQEVAARATDSISGDLVSPAGACIQTTSQRLYLFYSHGCSCKVSLRPVGAREKRDWGTPPDPCTGAAAL